MSNNEEKERRSPEEVTDTEPMEQSAPVEEASIEAEAPAAEADTAAEALQPEEAAAAESADAAVAEAPVVYVDAAAVEAVGTVSAYETAPVNMIAVNVQKKKRSYIQIPVLISLGVVLLSLIGYFVGRFVYDSFFYHIPEGIIWELETEDDAILYFEFSEDGICTMTQGTVEETYRYERSCSNGDDIITVEGFIPAKYEITGSRLRKDQVMTFSYDENEQQDVFHQVEEKTNPLDELTTYQADEALLGDWDYTTEDNEFFATFGDDGKMCFGRRDFHTGYSITYNGTYTVSDGKIIFTYCQNKPDAIQLDYSVDKGELSVPSLFPDFTLRRPGSETTPDEK